MNIPGERHATPPSVRLGSVLGLLYVVSNPALLPQPRKRLPKSRRHTSEGRALLFPLRQCRYNRLRQHAAPTDRHKASSFRHRLGIQPLQHKLHQLPFGGVLFCLQSRGQGFDGNRPRLRAAGGRQGRGLGVDYFLLVEQYLHNTQKRNTEI